MRSQWHQSADDSLDAPSDAAAPGFAGAKDLPACRDPLRAFRLLCDSPARGISMDRWVRMAPKMGIADFITADSTFDQLAAMEDSKDDEERHISAEILKRYCERIVSKSAPGAAKVGERYLSGVTGVRKGMTAEKILEGVKSADEQVLMAGGIPSYLVQDMTTTPRTSGTIILTTHALYWRQNSSIRQRVSSKIGGEPVKLKKFELLYTPPEGDEVESEWHVEACRAGPWGLGVTDSGLRIRRRGRGKDGKQADFELRYNFPMNTELRDTFVAAVVEVLAAHAFSVKRLNQPPGVLPPAVSAAVVGAVVRQRAARSLASHGGPNRCRLPFSVVEAEPQDSLLPQQLAQLLIFADEREHRAAEAVAAAFATDREQRNQGGSLEISRPVSKETLLDPSLLDPTVADASAANRHPRSLLPRSGSPEARDSRSGESRTTEISGAEKRANEMDSKEMNAADAVAAAAAKRRELAKGTERAQATFAALPFDEEKRIRRIKHNLRLISSLITVPVQHLRDAVYSLLGWENPGTSGALFSLLQVMVLFDMLHYTPAVVILAAAANVMETQKRKSRDYRVEYYYPETRGVLKKARRLDTIITMIDTNVNRITVCLLKIHSAFASVDNDLSLRFALGLLALGGVLTAIALSFCIVPPWLFLSTAITLGFGVRHPLRALVHASEGTEINVSSAAAAGLWSGAAMVPVLCVAPFERVVATAAACALTVAGLAYKKVGEAGNHPRASGTAISWSREMQRQVREWWEMLPAPTVVNTADTGETEHKP